MTTIPFNEEHIVDARSCIKDLANGRIGFEKVMLRYYDLIELGQPTPGLNRDMRTMLEHIRFIYQGKERNRNGILQ